MDIQDKREKREIVVTKRLTCRIPHEADRLLGREILRLKSKKGRTVKALVELVIGCHDHPIRPFTAENEHTVACALDVSEEWIEDFAAYRDHHSLWQYTDFFHNALLRGLSIRLDGVA